jgi:adenylosuccinate lyase
MYGLSRIQETINNLANYVAWGRSDDVNIFFFNSPKKKKGSSGMPHKDVKGGNPTGEEQNMSCRNYTVGNLVTAMLNCQMPYARNLAASSDARINFEDGFKFMDHCVRRMSSIVYWLGLNKERSEERVTRSFGVVTSNRVLAYLTDHRKTENPMSRKDAHDLLGELATEAYNHKIPFFDTLVNNREVLSRIDSETLSKIANPLNYYGESKRIVQMVADQYHKKKTL